MYAVSFDIFSVSVFSYFPVLVFKSRRHTNFIYSLIFFEKCNTNSRFEIIVTSLCNTSINILQILSRCSFNNKRKSFQLPWVYRNPKISNSEELLLFLRARGYFETNRFFYAFLISRVFLGIVHCVSITRILK